MADALAEATAGAVAGAIATAALYPIDVVLVRYLATAAGRVPIRTSPAIRRRPEPSTASRATRSDSGAEHGEHRQPRVSRVRKSTPAIAPPPKPERRAALADIIISILQESNGGFYSAMEIKVLEVCLRNFIYYYCFRVFKNLFRGSKHVGSTTARNLLLGTLSAMITQLVTVPMDVIGVRMLTENRQTPPTESTPPGDAVSLHSLSNDPESVGATGKPSTLTAWRIIQGVISKHGVGGLYQGLSASLMLCINPAVADVCYDSFKYALQLLLYSLDQRDARIVFSNEFRPTPSDQALPTLAAFSCFVLGALAKSVATVLTYPLIRSKIQLQARRTQQDVLFEDTSGVVGSPPAPVSIARNLRLPRHHLERCPPDHNNSNQAANGQLSFSLRPEADFDATSSANDSPDEGPPVRNSNMDNKHETAAAVLKPSISALFFQRANFSNTRCSHTNDGPRRAIWPLIPAESRSGFKILKRRWPASTEGMLSILVTTVINEGPGGLYRGLSVQLIKNVLSAALLFMIKEKIYVDIRKIAYTLGALLRWRITKRRFVSLDRHD